MRCVALAKETLSRAFECRRRGRGLETHTAAMQCMAKNSVDP